MQPTSCHMKQNFWAEIAHFLFFLSTYFALPSFTIFTSLFFPILREEYRLFQSTVEWNETTRLNMSYSRLQGVITILNSIIHFVGTLQSTTWTKKTCQYITHTDSYMTYDSYPGLCVHCTTGGCMQISDCGVIVCSVPDTHLPTHTGWEPYSSIQVSSGLTYQNSNSLLEYLPKIGSDM